MKDLLNARHICNQAKKVRKKPDFNRSDFEVIMKGGGDRSY